MFWTVFMTLGQALRLSNTSFNPFDSEQAEPMTFCVHSPVPDSLPDFKANQITHEHY